MDWHRIISGDKTKYSLDRFCEFHIWLYMAAAILPKARRYSLTAIGNSFLHIWSPYPFFGRWWMYKMQPHQSKILQWRQNLLASHSWSVAPPEIRWRCWVHDTFSVISDVFCLCSQKIDTGTYDVPLYLYTTHFESDERNERRKSDWRTTILVNSN